MPVPKETPKDLEGVMGRFSCCIVSGDMKLCVAPGSTITMTRSPLIVPAIFKVFGLELPIIEFNEISGWG